MVELKKALGLSMLTFYGVGMILGAGIYSVIGRAAGLAGESLWLSFLLASGCASLTALSYAELSTFIPKAGAEYNYLSNAFPRKRWLATASGLMMAFSGAATAAAVALAFGGYLAHFVQFSIESTAIVLIVLFSLVNIYGIRESSRVNVLFTSIEVTGLLVLIFLGITSPNFGHKVTKSDIANYIFLHLKDLINESRIAEIHSTYFDAKRALEGILKDASKGEDLPKHLREALLKHCGIKSATKEKRPKKMSTPKLVEKVG